MLTVRSVGLNLIVLVVLLGCSNPSTRLDSLANELQRRRALPAGTSTDCPENLKSLIGVTLDEVKRSLGQPATWGELDISYPFGSPWDGIHAGGGLPEVTFVAGKNGTVKDVYCLYSQ